MAREASRMTPGLQLGWVTVGIVIPLTKTGTREGGVGSLVLDGEFH